MKIDERLRRLEDAAASAGDMDLAQVADAALVLSMVERLANRFPESAGAIPLAERIAKMSPAEHCAWEMRFAQEQTPVSGIMAMHGVPFPAFDAEQETYHAHR